MYLPRLLGKVEDHADEPTLSAVRAQGDELILVCEDDEDVRAYSSEVLRELGYKVLEASDGPSSLALLETNGHIDLLFTDVVLPGGMTGAVLAREAAKLQPGIRHCSRQDTLGMPSSIRNNLIRALNSSRSPSVMRTSRLVCGTFSIDRTSK